MLKSKVAKKLERLKEGSVRKGGMNNPPLSSRPKTKPVGSQIKKFNADFVFVRKNDGGK